MPGVAINEGSEVDTSGEESKQEGGNEEEQPGDKDDEDLLDDGEAVDEAVFDTATFPLVPTEGLKKTIEMESKRSGPD